MALMYNGKSVEAMYFNGKRICKIFYNGVERIICGSPPSVSAGTGTINSEVYQFKVGDFTNNFSDPDGDSYHQVKLSLPSYGTLKYLGTPITSEEEILIKDLPGLTYTLPMNYTVEGGSIYKYSKDVSILVQEYKTSGYNLVSHQGGVMTFQNSVGEQLTLVGIPSTIKMNFYTSDDSYDKLYSNVQVLTLQGQGDVHVQPAYVNSDPVVSDSSIKVLRSAVKVLTRDLFLRDYSDAEGDAPYSVEVLALPTNGVVALNGVPVTVGQFILFTDIDNELLTFDPDDNTAVINVALEFKVHDNA